MERCQSYVSDARCDGGPLNWEYKKLFSGSTPEDLTRQGAELAKLDLIKFKEAELERMKFNVSEVCEEVATRVNGAPGPGGYMTSYASKEVKKHFFQMRTS